MNEPFNPYADPLKTNLRGINLGKDLIHNQKQPYNDMELGKEYKDREQVQADQLRGMTGLHPQSLCNQVEYAPPSLKNILEGEIETCKLRIKKLEILRDMLPSKPSIEQTGAFLSFFSIIK